MQTGQLARAAASHQRRVVTIALVAAIHVAVVYGLIVTLRPELLSFPPRPITVIGVPRLQTNPLPPPADIHPTFANPALPDMPRAPRFDDTPGQITAVPPPGAAGGTDPVQLPPPLSALTPARAIARTHTIPAYPPIAARLNEQGSVRLRLDIDEQGAVIDAEVLTSSGYTALDSAAVTWVKTHWRYAPALRDGAPIPASTEAVVTFRLTNRQY